MATQTAMDVAARGLQRAGDALVATYEATRQVLPLMEQHAGASLRQGERALVLAERAVVAGERAVLLGEAAARGLGWLSQADAARAAGATQGKEG